jgi:hypothetical protein
VLLLSGGAEAVHAGEGRQHAGEGNMQQPLLHDVSVQKQGASCCLSVVLLISWML